MCKATTTTATATTKIQVSTNNVWQAKQVIKVLCDNHLLTEDEPIIENWSGAFSFDAQPIITFLVLNQELTPELEAKIKELLPQASKYATLETEAPKPKPQVTVEPKICVVKIATAGGSQIAKIEIGAGKLRIFIDDTALDNDEDSWLNVTIDDLRLHSTNKSILVEADSLWLNVDGGLHRHEN